MLEIIEELHLGEWATFVIVVTALWKFVFKSLVDSWFKNKLELQKQEVNNALQIQKDLVLKKAEFEKIKLERVLPLLEGVNSAIASHKMLFNTYMQYIVNKCGDKEKLEQIRLENDEKMISFMPSLSIYLPDEFRSLVYQLRKIVSCSVRDPVVTAKVLREIGAGKTVPLLAQDLYSDLINCFHAMCNKYLGLSESESSYKDILDHFDLNKKSYTIKSDPENDLAWKFLLLHEYYGSGEQFEAQSNVERLYKLRANENA